MSDPYSGRGGRGGFDGNGTIDFSRGGPEMSTQVPRAAALSEANISRLSPDLQVKIRNSNRTIFKSPWFWGVVVVLVIILVVVLMPKDENMAWGREPNRTEPQATVGTNADKLDEREHTFGHNPLAVTGTVPFAGLGFVNNIRNYFGNMTQPTFKGRV